MKNNYFLISFLQALGVTVYCIAVAGLMFLMENIIPGGEVSYLNIALILVLLVLSAAICGSLVFGYPAYLIFQKQTNLGVKILILTGLWLMAFLGIIVIILWLWK